jgi:hypothetical protein
MPGEDEYSGCINTVPTNSDFVGNGPNNLHLISVLYGNNHPK